MATLELKGIEKIYPGGAQAVFDFNLTIKDKEFIVFVGPSGCGKSTTLRMIAGLEDITKGTLKINGKVVNDVAPKDRDIAMVFQSYALYPHMTVYDNMAFGLKLRKMDKAEIEKRVKQAARKLGLEDYLSRKPKALSGGQRQRVALGRAIVRDASVFLMDEPLSNLDAKLRVQTRSEIIKLHNDIETTTIYVTHDQIEAMTMATRIVVMKDGKIQQIGTPKEVYDTPANVFVGGFIGTPPMNFIKGKLDERGHFVAGGKDGEYEVDLKIPAGKLSKLEKIIQKGNEVIFGIRPESITNEQIVKDTYKDSTMELTVSVAEMLGSTTNIYANIAGSNICSSIDGRVVVKAKEKLMVAVDMNKSHFFDIKTEVRFDV